MSMSANTANTANTPYSFAHYNTAMSAGGDVRTGARIFQRGVLQQLITDADGMRNNPALAELVNQFNQNRGDLAYLVLAGHYNLNNGNHYFHCHNLAEVKDVMQCNFERFPNLLDWELTAIIPDGSGCIKVSVKPPTVTKAKEIFTISARHGAGMELVTTYVTADPIKAAAIRAENRAAAIRAESDPCYNPNYGYTK